MSRIIGEKHGKLTILDSWYDYSSGGHPKHMVRVRCDCGNEYARRWQGLSGSKKPQCRECYLTWAKESKTPGIQMGKFTLTLGQWTAILDLDEAGVVARRIHGETEREALMSALAEKLSGGHPTTD